jgi:hypothetical protein
MGKKATEKANLAMEAQTKIAGRTLDIGEGILKESAPARQAAQNTYMGLSQGNVPGIEKFVGPQINAATQQFSLAKQSIENMPPGPARDIALRNLKLQEAGTKTGIYSSAPQEATARLASMGWGGTQAGVGTIGQAGEGYSGIAQGYNEMASSKGGMAGSGAGAAGSIAAAAIAA